MQWKREQIEWFEDQNFEGSLSSIYSLVANVADKLGRTERVGYWATNGLQHARNNGLVFSLGSLEHMLFPGYLSRGEYEDAFRAVYDSAKCVKASMIALESSGDILRPGLNADTLLGAKPSTAWADVDTMAVQQVVTPVVLRLGSALMADANMHLQETQRCIEACDNFSRTASIPELWTNAAKLLHMTFLEETPALDLKGKADEMEKEGYGDLRMAGYLCSTLSKDVPLSAAAIMHTVVLEYMSRSVGGLDSLVKLVTAPFICTYWEAKFATRRFEFMSPQLLEKQLTEIDKYESMDDLKSLMQSVVFSAAGRLPSSLGVVSDWLQSH